MKGWKHVKPSQLKGRIVGPTPRQKPVEGQKRDHNRYGLKHDAKSKAARTCDGVIFDSAREMRRYQDLKLMLRAGEIENLELQPPYALHTLTPEGEWVHVATFRPDFRYVQVNTAKTVVEDVKSEPTKTTAYRLRKRWAEAEYAITVMEV